MKKLTSLALSLAILASAATSVSAVNVGKAVDYALHTDIVAQINGNPLRSYNVGGRTAVVAEDLADYGFQVSWNGVDRVLEVRRAVNSRGEAIDPDVYPEFRVDALRAPIGSRAEAIYATDIKTYVAQDQVDGFNIDGRTLIWFSDLDSYGDVVWDAENRVANLVLGDPMMNSLQKVIQPLVDWAGENADYDLHQSTKGTLFVGYYYGTPHGTSCIMEYVDLAGNRININTLMPEKGFLGADLYLKPRNIVLSDNYLYFTTTFGGTEEHRITVDLKEGKVIASQPVVEILSKWNIACELESAEEAQEEHALEITITKSADKSEAVVTDCSIPYANVKIEADQSKVLLFPGRSSDPDYEDYPFGKACRALARSNLPSIFRDEYFNPKNTVEQRRTASRFFRITYNGAAVPGDLFWIGKNGSHVLRFNFDHTLTIKEGDVVKIWVGAQ